MITIAPWLLDYLHDFVLLLAGASFAYHLLALWEARTFTRSGTNIKPAHLPPVSILKPLAHWDEETRRNVRSFCEQHYPRLQIILGPKPDAAFRLRTSPPCEQGEHVDVSTVVCHEDTAINPKISQVLQMWPHVRHDWIILADQDMRVGPDYVRRVTAPLHNPEVGLVTCFHAVREAATLPSLIEALLINAEYLPSVLVGRRLMGMRFAFGATLATRRDVLTAMGGFQALADYLADDYQMARLTVEQGYRVELSDYMMESRLPPMTWPEMLRHQIRWARTNRACAPQGWFFSIITHLLLWLTVLWVVGGFSVLDARLLFAALLFRGLETTYYNHVFNGIRPAWKGAWLTPLQDLVYFFVWLWSFRMDEVDWAGNRYEVFPDGTMRQVAPEGVTPASPGS